jgi:hypothetical protein
MDVSQITDYLYIASRLREEVASDVHALGVRLVISMAFERRPPASLQELGIDTLWLHTFDSPLTPIPLRTLKRGVRVALPVIRGREGVLVYCNGGRHRSVAMASAILIAMSYSAEEAMGLISERREVADPRIWYIQRRILKFERHWQRHGGHATGESA